MDAGKIKCELKKGSKVLTTSTAEISVDSKSSLELQYSSFQQICTANLQGYFY